MGDTIGVVSPASPVAAACPRRFGRGVRELEAKGFRVKVGEHALASTGHTAGTVEQRLSDVHAMFEAPDVKAILCTIGGYNSHQLLEGLDYELIRANPKLFVGYSDITAMHATIFQQTGLPTILGPALLPQFGEYGGPHTYTWSNFERVVMSSEAAGELAASSEWIDEKLHWETEDDRPRRTTPNPGPRTLREGMAEGPIVAGNGGTLLLLAGTPYWPDMSGAIFCLEEDEGESPATIDRILTQLRHIGVFDQIAGLVMGRFRPEVGFTADDPLDLIVEQATSGYDFPISLDFDFGHTDPMFPLPYGVRARLEAGSGFAPRFSLLEPAVR